MSYINDSASILSSEDGYGSYFVNRYTTKYTLHTLNAPEVPIFKHDGITAYPNDPSTEKSEYQVVDTKDKLQLRSSNPANITSTTLVYNKKQRIEVRISGPELFSENTALETIPLEWYWFISKPKLMDLKFASGKLYRWLWIGGGSFHLIDKTKDSVAKDTLVAAVKFFRGGIFITSITGAAYEKGSGLTDEIILVSAFGVIKKCEHELIQLGPPSAGGAPIKVDIWGALGAVQGTAWSFRT